MYKFLHILGARPNFIKAAPVIKEIENNDWMNIVVHTNQHYDYLMSNIFFEQLSIPEPNFNLGIKSGSHGFQTGSGIIKIEEVLLSQNPDFVVVYGDVNSSLSGAIAAVKLNIPIIHIESGCRSFDTRMPEEINRILIDRVSSFLSCTENSAVINLRNEGISGDYVINAGNTAIDAISYLNLDNYPSPKKGYYVGTFHRVSNVDNPIKLEKILEKLNTMNKPVYLPTHPRIKKRLNTGSYSNIIFIDPLGYLEFLNLIRNSDGGISDSGGIQCEYGYFRKPLLTVRDSTEHLITLLHGNKLVKIDEISDETLKSISITHNRPVEWDGMASKRIINQVIKYFKL